MYSELKNLDLSLLGGPRLAEVGKIKIGGKGKKVTSKKGAQFRVPEKYDHFVITTNFKDPRTDDFVVDLGLMRRIGQQTGQDPANLRSIPITLLFDDPDLNFQVRFSCYTGARLWCVGDGAKAVRLKANGQREAVQCPCERVLPGYQGQEKCKVFGRLSVILEGAERIGGVWVFRTTSWNTARNILSSMLLIKQITGGILSGLPLVLTIQPKHVVLANGQGQTVYVVNVEYPGSIEQITRRALEIKRQRTEYKVRVELLENQVRKRLLAMPEVDEEEEKDIQEEFYPENGQEAQEPVTEEPAETQEENAKAELGPEEAAETQPISQSSGAEPENADQDDRFSPAETQSQAQEAEEWEEAAEFEEIDPESSQEGPPQTATLWD